MLLSLALALAVTAADPAPKRVEMDAVAAPTTVKELDTVYCVRMRRQTHSRAAPVCRPLWEWRAIKASAADHAASFLPVGNKVSPAGDVLSTRGGIVISTVLLEEASVGRARHLSIERQQDRAARELEVEAARQLIEEVDRKSGRK